MLINDIAFLLRKSGKEERKGKLNLHDAANFSSYAIHNRRRRLVASLFFCCLLLLFNSL